MRKRMGEPIPSRVSESESHSVVSNSLRPHGLLQARILESVAFPFSRGSSQFRGRTQGLLHCRQILYQLRYQGKKSIIQLLQPTNNSCRIHKVREDPRDLLPKYPNITSYGVHNLWIIALLFALFCLSSLSTHEIPTIVHESLHRGMMD